jgi:hypothetical protein
MAGQASSAAGVAKHAGEKLYETLEPYITEAVDNSARSIKESKAWIEDIISEYVDQTKKDSRRNPPRSTGNTEKPLRIEIRDGHRQ